MWPFTKKEKRERHGLWVQSDDIDFSHAKKYQKEGADGFVWAMRQDRPFRISKRSRKQTFPSFGESGDWLVQNGDDDTDRYIMTDADFRQAHDTY